MKIISLQLNTTGFGDNPNDKILEFCAWQFDTENKEHTYKNTPLFKRLIYFERLDIDILYLNMNYSIIKMLSKRSILDEIQQKEFDRINGVVPTSQELTLQFYNWLYHIGYIGDLTQQIRNSGVKITQNKQGIRIPKLNGIEDIDKLPKININLICKNYNQFELIFLKKLDHWGKLFNVTNIDIPTIFLKNDDDTMPNLNTCLLRSSLNNKKFDNNILNNSFLLGELLLTKIQ